MILFDCIETNTWVASFLLGTIVTLSHSQVNYCVFFFVVCADGTADKQNVGHTNSAVVAIPRSKKFTDLLAIA